MLSAKFVQLHQFRDGENSFKIFLDPHREQNVIVCCQRLSRRGLNPIKPVYDPDRPDGPPAQFDSQPFNQLGQYTSSPGRRGYCYAELAVFFTNGGRNHRQYSLRLPTEGWPGWVGLGHWLRSEIVYLPEGVTHPSTNQNQCVTATPNRHRVTL